MVKVYSILVLFIGLLILSCSEKKNSGNSASKKPTSKTHQDINALSDLGKKTYDAHCTLCHGKDGKLGLNNSAPLHTSTMNLEDRIEIITNGKGAMMSQSFLGPKKIKAVAEYIEKLRN